MVLLLRGRGSLCSCEEAPWLLNAAAHNLLAVLLDRLRATHMKSVIQYNVKVSRIFKSIFDTDDIGPKVEQEQFLKEMHGP